MLSHTLSGLHTQANHGTVFTHGTPNPTAVWLIISNTRAQVLTFKKLHIRKISEILLLYSSGSFQHVVGLVDKQIPLGEESEKVLQNKLKFLVTSASGTAQTPAKEIYNSIFETYIKGTKHFNIFFKHFLFNFPCEAYKL